MTKAGIIAAIDSALAIVITKAKVLAALLNLTNELWQTTITQTVVSGTNVFYYNLHYKKQGNIVYLDGYIVNMFTVAKSGVDILTIPDSLVFGKTGNYVEWFGITANSSLPIKIAIDGNKIKLIGALSAGVEIKINMHYQTND